MDDLDRRCNTRSHRGRSRGAHPLELPRGHAPPVALSEELVVLLGLEDEVGESQSMTPHRSSCSWGGTRRPRCPRTFRCRGGPRGTRHRRPRRAGVGTCRRRSRIVLPVREGLEQRRQGSVFGQVERRGEADPVRHRHEHVGLRHLGRVPPPRCRPPRPPRRGALVLTNEVRSSTEGQRRGEVDRVVRAHAGGGEVARTSEDAVVDRDERSTSTNATGPRPPGPFIALDRRVADPPSRA